MEDGTLDKFCVRCRKFAKQQIAMPTQAEMLQSISIPAGGETTEVSFYNGSEHIRIKVDKENLLKEMYKRMELSGYTLNGVGNSIGR